MTEIAFQIERFRNTQGHGVFAAFVNCCRLNPLAGNVSYGIIGRNYGRGTTISLQLNVFGQDVKADFRRTIFPHKSEGRQCAAPQYGEALTLVQASQPPMSKPCLATSGTALERVSIKWNPLIDKDTAQNQRVGACPNQKSRATFPEHALHVGAGLCRESFAPMEARRAFAPARGASAASLAAPYLSPEG